MNLTTTMFNAAFLTILLGQPAQSPSIDVFALMKATPKQADAMLGKRFGGTWEYRLNSGKSADTLGLLSRSVAQLERNLGKGQLTYARYEPTLTALPSASVQISFNSPLNNYVILGGSSPDCNWKMVLSAFGFNTDEIGVQTDDLGSTNLKEYKFRLKDPRAAFLNVIGHDYMVGEQDGIVTESSVEFLPKTPSPPKAKSTSKGGKGVVDFSFSYDHGKLTQVSISALGVMKPESLLKRVGIENANLTLAPRQDDWRKLWLVSSSDPRSEEWSLEAWVGKKETGVTLTKRRGIDGNQAQHDAMELVLPLQGVSCLNR